MNAGRKSNYRAAILFLLPNFFGFVTLTFVPIVLSLVMAFSNWDLKLHNIFKDENVKFVFFDNFIKMFNHPDFYRFLGNTLFLMIGIPFGIAGSLFLAVMLTKDLHAGGGRNKLFLVSGTLLIFGIILLLLFGFYFSAIIIFITTVFSILFVCGTLFGTSFYRTLFYLPSFTSGVAVFILWKKLYNPQTGPVNAILQPMLSELSRLVNNSPQWIFTVIFYLGIVIVFMVFSWWLRSRLKLWQDGYCGIGTVFVCLFTASLPFIFMIRSFSDIIAIAAIAYLIAMVLYSLIIVKCGNKFPSSTFLGLGFSVLLSSVVMIIELMIMGISMVVYKLPEMAGLDQGLLAPNWLGDYNWAKPSIMIMGIWVSVGSRNMLLYIAGISNVPKELYEASDIDGASSWQKFWNVTWPQLAPTTFFIVIMSVISGIQGGFEMARTMTEGGPAGSTTTLSYFIYNEGFGIGRLGYASAVSWVLFIMVMLITLFNWKVGNRYVND